MSVFSFGRDIVYLQTGSQAKSDREAIVILAGLGSKVHNERKIAQYFRDKGYDIYQPSYIYRKGIDKGVDKLERFSKKHELGSYKKVHFFCYIIGGWTFNRWYTKSGLKNIETVIYDRSPLQERAPYVLMKDSKLIAYLVIGKVNRELATTPYSPLTNFKGKIGLLIETVPTKLILRHRKTAASLGPIQWNVDSLNQVHTDYSYIPVNHDEMYTNIEKAGPLVLGLIERGDFGKSVNHIAPTTDPLI
nr:hypothetical protein [uncultured Fluviicola sp.]